MLAELDIHNLPDSHSHYGSVLQLTKECNDCDFFRIIVNRNWAPGHHPIGKVCLWGQNWKWLMPVDNPRACAKLAHSHSSKSTLFKVAENHYIPYGVKGEQFTLPLFKEVVGLYTRIVGGEPPRRGLLEFEYGKTIEDLKRINAVGLRHGSFVSDDSKLVIQWLFISKTSPEMALFFDCFPQAGASDNQGRYLSSRFELAVNQLLVNKQIAIPLNQ